MSWNTEKRSHVVKRKPPLPTTSNTNRNLKFDEYIQQQYTKLTDSIKAEITSLQEQKKQLINEKSTLQSSTSRGLIRRQQQVQKELKVLEDKLQYLESGKKIEEFQQNVIPYAEAFEREKEVYALEKIRDMAQCESHLPPDVKKPVSDESRSVMKDFMQEVENIPVETKVIPSELCDECDNIMVLESRSSVLCCPFCGNWRTHLDATSSHMAYGEEVEFTAFAYLRLNHYNERLTYSQAKESTQISSEDILKVMNQLYEKRYTDLSKITMEVTYLSLIHI